MADHTEFVELAQELIDTEGRVIELRHASTTPSNGTQPWKGSGLANDVTVSTKGVFLPPSGNEFGNIGVDKDMLKQVEQIVLVAPGNVELHTMTSILDDALVWRVEWVKVLKPADQVCLYAFGVKR